MEGVKCSELTWGQHAMVPDSAQTGQRVLNILAQQPLAWGARNGNDLAA